MFPEWYAKTVCKKHFTFHIGEFVIAAYLLPNTIYQNQCMEEERSQQRHIPDVMLGQNLHQLVLRLG